MKIKTIVEQKDGTYEFTAMLTPEQHQFLLEYAVRDLVAKGLVPFIPVQDAGEIAAIVPSLEEATKQ